MFQIINAKQIKLKMTTHTTICKIMKSLAKMPSHWTSLFTPLCLHAFSWGPGLPLSAREKQLDKLGPTELRVREPE